MKHIDNFPDNVVDSIRMIDSNTVEVLYKKNVVIQTEDIKEIFHSLYEITEQKRVKRLIVVGGTTTISHAAREYLEQENKLNKDKIIAEAVIVSSLAQKMTINFYLKFIKDSYPSRYFTDLSKAREWLNEFKD